MSDIFSDTDSSDDDTSSSDDDIGMREPPPAMTARELESFRSDGRLNDKKIVLHLLRTRRLGTILQYLPSELQDDAEVVEAAIFRVENGRVYHEAVHEIQYASERLRNDVSFIQHIRDKLRRAPVSKLETFDTMIPQNVIVNGPDSIRELSMAIRNGDLGAYETHKRSLKPYMATYVLHLIVQQKPSGWPEMFVDIKTRYPEAKLDWYEMVDTLLSNDFVFKRVVPLLRNDRDQVEGLSAELIKARDLDRLVYLSSGSAQVAGSIVREAFRHARWSNTAKRLTYDDEVIMMDADDMVISEDFDQFVARLVERLTAANHEPPAGPEQLVTQAVQLNAVSSLTALLKLGAPVEDELVDMAIPHVETLRLLLSFGARASMDTALHMCRKDAVQCLQAVFAQENLRENKDVGTSLAAHCVWWNAPQCLSFLLSKDMGCVVGLEHFKRFTGATAVTTPAKLEQMADIMNVEDFTAFPCRCLPCQHVFHGEFLQTWVNTEIEDYAATHTTCPTCKAEIDHVEIMSISAAKHWDKNERMALDSEERQRQDLKAFHEKTREEYETLQRRLAALDARKKAISSAAEAKQKELRDNRFMPHLKLKF